ncbi:MAG: CpaF family protein [Lachnospiraceae bacterium]|nr:CpaF family protein [Lachnospiraceae bacterium]
MQSVSMHNIAIRKYIVTGWEDDTVRREQIEETKERLRENIVRSINSEGAVSDEYIHDLIEEYVLKSGHDTYLSVDEKEYLVRSIYNSIRGLDVLQDIIDNPEITEIMVNGTSHIFIEKNGVIDEYPYSFSDKARLDNVVQQIVSKVNRMVNEANPIVDVRLLDGSRVNIVLPPVALDGPIITIRKFPDKPITMERLVEIGSITNEAVSFMKKLVRAKYNILISGGTGSGKTTFLNALSNYIPSDERIITIEDSAELQIQNVPNLVRLETRNANVEGKNEITIRDLIRSCMRMRPDRIIVGETRDASAFDMLQAFSTGADGSLSTIHSNSARDSLRRLETLVLMGKDIPVTAIRNNIASAIDISVQLGRLRDKSRKVLEISEILDVKDGDILVNPLYEFKEEGEDPTGKVIGCLKSTGNNLKNIRKLQYAGIEV